MEREMKDSGIEWIGKIPITWDMLKIKHCFRVISGSTPKSENEDLWNGEIPWITPADYKTRDVFVSCGKRNLSQEGYDSCGTTLVPAGSIIFSKRAPVGTVAIAQRDLCTNQGCLSCIPEGFTNSKYYYYLMSILSEQFELHSIGSTFKEISADTFSNFVLPHPTINEQKRIVSFLDTECSRVDVIADQIRNSIEECMKLKQLVITQSIIKGIRPNRLMRDSGIPWIGNIPYDWNMSTIGKKYYLKAVVNRLLLNLFMNHKKAI